MSIAMYKVEEIRKDNKKKVVEFLKKDVTRHVFAVYDIQYEPTYTKMYGAFEHESLKGYILTYTATEFPSVILEGENDAARILIGYMPKNNFILHAPQHLLPIIEEKFSDARCYVEIWMLVRTNQATIFKSSQVRRLSGLEDASKLMTLLSTREDRPRRNLDKYVEWTRRMPMYGVFINEELVSYAGSFIQLPQVWIIGGVYTHPSHRNKGYATFATSAITEEALKNADAASLFVRADNCPAIRVYEKLATGKLAKNLVEVGTGLKS
jgi:RimJ/RimL family protein N-acetyltransferase